MPTRPAWTSSISSHPPSATPPRLVVLSPPARSRCGEAGSSDDAPIQGNRGLHPRGDAPSQKGERKMKRFVILSAAVLLLAIILSPQPAAAQLVTARVNGGGTATFNGALDQVGIEGSQFGMQVDIYPDGSAQGNFKCLMAGRSDFPGFRIMEVTGKVTAGVGNPALGEATFSGDGVLTTGNGN